MFLSLWAEFPRIIFKFKNRGVARIFEGVGGGGGHTVSNPEYLPVWHVDIQAVFY